MSHGHVDVTCCGEHVVAPHMAPHRPTHATALPERAQCSGGWVWRVPPPFAPGSALSIRVGVRDEGEG
eukprot:3955645-Prymnesium_polylepis.1